MDFLDWFNKTFSVMIERYKGHVSSVIATPLRWMLMYYITSIMMLLLVRLPTGFLPSEDQGESMVQFSLPEGASLNEVTLWLVKLNITF